MELTCKNTLLWSSNTTDSDIDVFQYQSNGNLVIRKTDGTYAWESDTALYEGEPPDRLVLQNDGNLVPYAGSQARWHTKTYEKCDTGKFYKPIVLLNFFI